MTITTPTGQLWADVLISLAVFGLAFAGVALDATRRVRRGKW